MKPSLRQQFPILNQTINGYPLCYLDTAATSQKPLSVIQAISDYYQQHNANVHRAAHALSATATRQYEQVRDQLMQLIHAYRREEIIFTTGATQALNQLAFGLTEQVQQGDVILIDSAAHHANIVPWQTLAQRTGAQVIPIPLTDELRLDVEAYQQLLAQHPVKLVALAHVSNVLGTVNDVTHLTALAKAKQALVVIDGAQAIAHLEVDVQAIDCDFYVFSGHKMYAPTGVGVLWGRYQQLDRLQPLLTGGEMIKQVSFSQTTYAELPNRLEAGTPPIAAVLGLGAAIAFLQQSAKPHWSQEQQLLQAWQSKLAQYPQLELYGVHPSNQGVIAFNIKGEHHQDVGTLFDQQGVAIRCGHHCAQPLMSVMQISGCCRLSLGIYSNQQDFDLFFQALDQVLDILGVE